MVPGVRVAVYAIGYTTLLGSWMALVIYSVPEAEQIISYIQATLSALTGHILTMIQVK